jgi:uncharacterized membrane protein
MHIGESMSDTGSIIISGIVIAIPVGITVNVLSPPIQRWVETTFKRSGEKRQRTRETYEEQVSAYAQDRTSFHIYLTEQILRTTVFSALFGLISGLAFAAGQGLNLVKIFEIGTINISSIFYLIGQLAALVGTMIVFNIARSALRTVISVRSIKRASGQVN